MLNQIKKFIEVLRVESYYVTDSSSPRNEKEKKQIIDKMKKYFDKKSEDLVSNGVKLMRLDETPKYE